MAGELGSGQVGGLAMVDVGKPIRGTYGKVSVWGKSGVVTMTVPGNTNTHVVFHETLNILLLLFSRVFQVASFPGLPRCFVLWFAFSIIHGGGRVRKTGKV